MPDLAGRRPAVACVAAAALVVATFPAGSGNALAGPGAASPGSGPADPLLPPRSAAAADGATAVTVDLGAPSDEALERDLLGLSQVPDNETLADDLADEPSPTVRVDAYLDRGVHPAPGEFNFSALDRRLDLADRADAEPVLILSYMPAWMSACQAPDPRDPTRCPPANLTRWGELVEETAIHAAERGVSSFEVWNEPDNPLFFQGNLVDYLAMYGAAARAIEDAEAATDEDLSVGGPAAAGPDPVFIQGLLEHAAVHDLPVDFVSWHWYANSPFIGDFDHEQLPRSTPEALDQESPALDPRHYRAYTETVRSWVATARLQGLASDPEIWVTEWNVNAGDDPRHRTHEGAAFAAASLTQMEAADLDRAYYFNTQGESWGMYGPHGEPRPVRDAYRLVGDVPDPLVPVDRGPWRSHLHAAAGANATSAALLLANFHGAEPRALNVTLDVTDPPGALASVEAVTPPGDDVAVTVVDDEGPTRRYQVDLPAQSVARIAWSAS